MTEALEAFKKTNGVYPSNLIIYRDGVGDQQKKKTFVKINWTTFHVIFSVRDLKFVFIYFPLSQQLNIYNS